MRTRFWESRFFRAAALCGLSGLIALYAWAFGSRNPLPVRLLAAVLLGGGFLLVSLSLLFHRDGWLKAVWKKRYLLAGVLGLAWTALSLSNSSIAAWQELLSGVSPETLWGKVRLIRADEWAVWTPAMISQAKGGFPALNTSIDGCALSPFWYSVGGLPALDPILLFRPFHWAYVLLGAERGLSLVTFLRGALLLAVSFRCAMEYTGGSRLLSGTAALLILFSPYVQWFFSQSVCEVLIFGQGMVLALLFWLRAEKRSRRWLAGVFLAWLLGCYALIAYPAWLISAGWLLLAVCAGLLRRHRARFRRRDLFSLLLPLAGAAALAVLFLLRDRETLLRVAESAYPGTRLYTGGRVPLNLLSGLYSLTFPVLLPAVSNTSELSNFITLAPAGLILALGRMLRARKAEGLDLLLIAVEAVFWLFQLLGFPAWLASFTLLSQCTRNVLVLGLCDLILLLRGLSLSREGLPPRFVLPAAALCAGAGTLLWRVNFGLPWWLLLPLCLLTFCLYVLVCLGQARRFTALLLCGLALLGGGFVNPLQQGFDAAEDLPLVQAVASLPGGQEELVALEGESPLTNLPMLAGIPSLNATQPYADPDRWAPVDPEGKYRSVYNRLCHISLSVGEETSFTLRTPDNILARLTLEDLRKLGVTCLISQRDYPELIPVAEASGWKIWRLPETGSRP